MCSPHSVGSRSPTLQALPLRGAVGRGACSGPAITQTVRGDVLAGFTFGVDDLLGDFLLDVRRAAVRVRIDPAMPLAAPVNLDGVAVNLDGLRPCDQVAPPPI